MPVRTIGSLQVEVDGEGYLVNPQDWAPEIAEAFAQEEGIALTDRHWEVINFVRKFYEENGQSPTIRQITVGAGIPTKDLFKLFPGGPAKKVARIAGVPKPAGCI